LVVRISSAFTISGQAPMKKAARYTEPDVRIRIIAMNKQLITIDPEIHSGTPVFAGTRTANS
jgi:hypothetical protein